MLLRHVRRAAVTGGVTVAAIVLSASASGAVVSSAPTSQWIPNSGVHALATDGTYLYLGGMFTSLKDPSSSATQTHTRLARVNLVSGLPDPRWTPVVDGDVTAMTLNEAQTVLYVGGSFTHVDSSARSHLAALSTKGTGSLTDWNPGASDDVLAMITIGADVMVGGSFATVAGKAYPHLAELTSSGSLVSAFHPAVNNTVHAISQPPGASFVVIGGKFTVLNTSARLYIGAVTLATGSTTSWNAPNPCVVDPEEACLVLSLATTATDYYAAVAGPGGRTEDFSATTGARKWSVSADGDVQVLLLLDGTLYVGGHFGPSFGNETAYALAAVVPATGALITSFAPRATMLFPGNVAMVGTTMGLAVGGDTLAIGGTTQKNLAVFPTTRGMQPTDVPPDSDVTIPATAITVGITKTITGSFPIQLVGVNPVTDDVSVSTTLKGADPACPLSDTTSASFISNDTWDASYSITPTELSNACAQAKLTVTWTDLNNLASGSQVVDVSLRRASRYVSLNASPEPVKKGGTVTTKATIERANWDDDAYHTYYGQPSELQFRTTTGSYADVKSVVAATGGKLSAAATQSVAGCWRYTFAGTSITAPKTAVGDCVALK
jgi:hypothetical protein